MLHGRSVLAVIPARGGSKGVPLKNIRPLCGRPLIAHVQPLIESLGFFDRVVVSTDDERIAEVAIACGLEVPFVRPAEFAADDVPDVPVLRHALVEMERIDGRAFDVIVMLQPTCPLRRPEHVRRAINAVVDGGWDAAWTVTKADLKFHPLKQLRLTGEQLTYYDEAGSLVTARQQLEQLYFRNGAAYALTRECVMTQNRLLGVRTTAIVIDDRLVNIDTLEDFDAAEREMSLMQSPGPGAR